MKIFNLNNTFKKQYLCINNITLSLFSIQRNVLGTKNLGDILSERESIASAMQSTLDEATDPWGVKVERVEV